MSPGPSSPPESINPNRAGTGVREGGAQGVKFEEALHPSQGRLLRGTPSLNLAHWVPQLFGLTWSQPWMLKLDRSGSASQHQVPVQVTLGKLPFLSEPQFLCCLHPG